jgi:lipopolysaccharide heptosyltransferase I
LEKRILIIKPSSLGDIIHALPVLKALRDKWPKARISWLIKDIYTGIFDGNTYIDELILFKKNSLTTAIISFRKRLREGKFDIAIDMQGLFRSALIAYLSGASARVGFLDAKELAPLFYTDKVDAPRKLHAVERNLKLAASLGCEIREIKFPLTVDRGALVGASEFLKQNQLNTRKPLITLVPGGRWEKKRWPAHSFTRLAGLLSQELNASILFIGNNEEEKLINGIRAAMKTQSTEAIDLPLPKLTALLSKSDVVVTNDSGPIHIAAALGTPVVALFGPTDPEQTGPYTKKQLIIRKDMECIPCFRKRCIYDSFVCMESITPEEVFEGIKSMLNRQSRNQIGLTPC